MTKIFHEFLNETYTFNDISDKELTELAKKYLDVYFVKNDNNTISYAVDGYIDFADEVIEHILGWNK